MSNKKIERPEVFVSFSQKENKFIYFLFCLCYSRALFYFRRKNCKKCKVLLNQ